MINETFDHKSMDPLVKAIQILEPLDRKYPGHPGVTHYLIHSYDFAPIAKRGVPFANKYAKIAQSAPHALHMPSHIYSMVGMWEASIAANTRTVAASMDDAMLALFQNGERLRPENGYPVRLFLPGWEGNMSVKWLRRLKVVAAPIMTKDETSRYTDLQGDGKSLMFTYPMEVKSVITRPSHGMTLPGAGLHQITGIAWSGNGTISKVEVSTDGGKTWTEAPLGAPVLPRALTRFRLPWKWDGSASVLKSRATDDTGAVQPERDKFIAAHGNNAIFHFNGIQAWSVAVNGEVRHVYA